MRIQGERSGGSDQAPSGISLKWLFPSGRVAFYFRTAGFLKPESVAFLHRILQQHALSRKSFRLAGPVMFFVIITMFFSGGLIPTFILVRNLGLYNTRLAVVLPYSVGAWNLIISRVYIQTSIPDSLVESAKMDGASEFRILTSIIVPLSKPLLAIISLFAAVMFWNSYFPALLYLPNPKLQPVQVFLVRLLVYASNELAEETDNIVDQAMALSQIKYIVVIITILPIVCLYPFVQKYFVKGIMIGAIKG